MDPDTWGTSDPRDMTFSNDRHNVNETCGHTGAFCLPDGSLGSGIRSTEAPCGSNTPLDFRSTSLGMVFHGPSDDHSADPLLLSGDKLCPRHARRRARTTSASRDRIASRYFSRMLSSTCFLNTMIGSSSCSIRHVGHSMLVSNHFIIHLVWKTWRHLSFFASCLRAPTPSRHTAHVFERCAGHFPSSTAFFLHLDPARVTEEQFILC